MEKPGERLQEIVTERHEIQEAAYGSERYQEKKSLKPKQFGPRERRKPLVMGYVIR